MKKAFKIPVILLGTLVLCWIILANITISVPKVRDMAVDWMAKALGREVSLQNLRINLLRGAELDGIVIANSKGFAEEVFFQGKKVVIGYRYGRWFAANLSLKRSFLSNPGYSWSETSEAYGTSLTCVGIR